MNFDMNCNTSKFYIKHSVMYTRFFLYYSSIIVIIIISFFAYIIFF